MNTRPVSRRLALAAFVTCAALLPATVVSAAGPPGAAGSPPAVAQAAGWASGYDDGARAPGTPGGQGKTAADVRITLITGDVVTYRPGAADGDPGALLRVDQADRPSGERPGYREVFRDGHLHVIPSDVAHLVPGVLDPRLFDVTGLAAAGYDDASRDTLPLIVEPPAASGSRRIAPPDLTSGLERRRGLNGLGTGAVAGEVARDGRMPDVVRELLASRGQGGATASPAGEPPSESATDQPASVSATGPSATSTPSSSGDRLGKVWLDAPVRMSDADSMPQVGAPQAWDGGWTGDGVRIAVVDSGVDAEHPDLAGAVVAARDFTGLGSVADAVGHGTHVASIAAGRGVADPANRGVAPDADLLNARVLDADGAGFESWIISGMTWAAEQGADVVNLSVGAPGSWTDGSDPMARAVNRISRESGALFVVAAGNDGGRRTVNTPGSATRALTVSAVDDHDELAGFSSTGPRTGDAYPKPEIAGPGVGIVAARAAGTSMGRIVDENYVAADGTSMATPHVAGAAAAVLEKRPGLSAPDLKSVLIGAAQDGPPATWAEGSGRLWIPGALRQPVIARPGALSFGRVPFDSPSVTKQITYANKTAAPVTYDLDLDVTYDTGDPAPAGLMTLDRDRVTVPAGGSARVGVVFDGSTSAGGSFSGVLVARDAQGRTVRTPVGVRDEREIVTLRIEGIDRDGGPASSDPTGAYDYVVMANLDEKLDNRDEIEFTDGVATLEVPTGTYFLGGTFTLEDDSAQTLVSHPELDVTGDTTVVLDARDGVPLTFSTHRPIDTDEVRLTLFRPMLGFDYGEGVGGGGPGDLYVLPTEPVTKGELIFQAALRGSQPLIELRAGGDGGDPVRLRYLEDSEHLIGKVRTGLVDGGSGSPEDLAAADVAGNFVLVPGPEEQYGDVSRLAADAKAAGALGLVLHHEGSFLWANPGDSGLPVLWADDAQGDRLRDLLAADAVVPLSGTSRDRASYRYTLAEVEHDAVPSRPAYRADGSNTAPLTLDVRTLGGRHQVLTSASASTGVEWMGPVTFESELSAPSVTTEYVSTDPAVTWTHGAAVNTWDNAEFPQPFTGAARTYAPGERARLTFGAQAHHGGLYGEFPHPAYSSAWRDGELLGLRLPTYVDDAGHWLENYESQVKVRFRLWADDELIADEPYAPFGTAEMPTEERAYRLRLDTERSQKWWTMSTKVSTQWRFPSGSTAELTVLPLLTLDYGLTLDDRNRGDRTERALISVGHQQGSTAGEVAGVRLWWSADDGATWHRTPATPRDDGRWAADVTVPEGTAYVSLRAETWDGTGSRLKETVIRAYKIK
ncbi:S8 family peptidase [Myceligenerans crystallogenes]|uniref:S8 family serine peptidase n=1 Tax=Myceligenerans crystallogenes TaxID=316335 RepID=A0ABN2N5R6_9MICO